MAIFVKRQIRGWGYLSCDWLAAKVDCVTGAKSNPGFKQSGDYEGTNYTLIRSWVTLKHIK